MNSNSKFKQYAELVGGRAERFYQYLLDSEEIFINAKTAPYEPNSSNEVKQNGYTKVKNDD